MQVSLIITSKYHWYTELYKATEWGIMNSQNSLIHPSSYSKIVVH